MMNNKESLIVRQESRPWFEVGESFEDHAALAQLQPVEVSPYCIYVHVPYCTQICQFCALYTRALPSHQDETLDEYMSAMARAIEIHPQLTVNHPPTTVHFGGGTPLILGAKRFSSLVEMIRHQVGDDPACEWALETTTTSIDAETIALFQSLNIDRIHLGVQTLDDSIRTSVGRRETGAQALDKVRQLVEHGFHVSVDLILGFEGMTDDIVRQDIKQLYDAGVIMFSICELRSRKHKTIVYLNDADRMAASLQHWKIIWNFMLEHGLRPIHIGQFGESDRDNLYFTHPARNEDCAALGPYAHGKCNGFYYSNKLMPEYYEALAKDESPVEGGVKYSEDLEKIQQAERELLSHCLSYKSMEAVGEYYGDDTDALFDRWHENNWTTIDRDGLHLTAEGSWYVGNMVMDLRQMASEYEEVTTMG